MWDSSRLVAMVHKKEYILLTTTCNIKCEKMHTIMYMYAKCSFLTQQDVIGQNLADITHPEFSANIADSLKPSLILPTSLVDEFIVSQHKQFFMRLKPNVSYSASPSHCVRCVLALSLPLPPFLSLSLFCLSQTDVRSFLCFFLGSWL